MRSTIYTAIIIASWLLPTQSFAQDTNIGISGLGLVSFQPVNDAYVGSPYLDEGIGGLAPGVAVGAQVFAANGFALIGELSTTRELEQFQTGRLVWANRSNFSHEGAATTRLRDTLISGLVGYAASTSTQRVVFAGGLSYVRTTLRQDALDVEDQVGDYGLEGRRRFAVTGGIDVLQKMSTRISLVIGGRYSWLRRAEVSDQTGAGEHILRIGAGIRVRLN